MAVLSAGRGRRLAIPRPVNWPLWAAVVAGLVAGGVAWQALTARSPSARVLAYARALEAGAVVAAADLTVTDARLEPALLAEAVPADELAAVVGKALDARVPANTLVARAQLRADDGLAPDQLAASVPVRPENAAGGAVRPGDAVVVLGTGRGPAEVVLDRAAVREVGRGGGLTLTLALTLDEWRRLTDARGRGELHVARLPAGAAPRAAPVATPVATPVPAPAASPAARATHDAPTPAAAAPTAAPTAARTPVPAPSR
jgi:hypothetical protein